MRCVSLRLPSLRSFSPPLSFHFLHSSPIHSPSLPQQCRFIGSAGRRVSKVNVNADEKTVEEKGVKADDSVSTAPFRYPIQVIQPLSIY